MNDLRGERRNQACLLPNADVFGSGRSAAAFYIERSQQNAGRQVSLFHRRSGMKSTRSLATFLLAGLCGTAVRSNAQPSSIVAHLGTCKLASGELLPDCRVSYRIFGVLNKERSNAVLLPTWFNGTSQSWAAYLGREGFVDTTVFAALAVDAFGAGRSTSPSDSAWRQRQFPAVAIRDMVEAQHTLLGQLGIETLHAVVGVSMGGMQAFEWAVAYPAMVSRMVSIEGSPQLSTYDRVQWEAVLHVASTEPALGVPRDSVLRQFARLFILAASSPAGVNARSADSTPIFIDNQARSLGRLSMENMALQLRAMIGHDIAKRTGGDLAAAGRAIQAKVLVVASPDDHAVTPQSALSFARAIGADTLVVPCACGHQVFGVERAQIGVVVRAFLSK